MRTLDLPGLPGPILFEAGAESVAAGFLRVFDGWKPDIRPSGNAPVLSVARCGDDFRVERLADQWSVREATDVSAICTLVVEAVAMLVADAPCLGSLHAAAAEFAGRLVVFPSTHRAGKSTMMVRLAAEGRRIFADDLLPVDLRNGEAVATGCLPRLRLPLPAGSPTLDRHVDAHRVLDDGYYCYVAAQTGCEVRHRDRAPIGAFVLLERSTDPVPARLERVAVEDALTALLLQNTNDRLAAKVALDGYLAVLGDAPAFKLHFSGLEDAVGLLGRSFRSWPERAVGSARRDAAARPRVGRARKPDPGRPADLLCRRADVALKIVGDAGFLADPRRDGLYRLNLLGVGLWNLLADPVCEDAALAVFCGAFPDVPKESIRRDLAAIVAGLLAEGLIERA